MTSLTSRKFMVVAIYLLLMFVTVWCFAAWGAPERAWSAFIMLNSVGMVPVILAWLGAQWHLDRQKDNISEKSAADTGSVQRSSG